MSEESDNLENGPETVDSAAEASTQDAPAPEATEEAAAGSDTPAAEEAPQNPEQPQEAENTPEPAAQTAEPQTEATPAESEAVAAPDASAEQPDGQVQESPEDLSTDPSAVDPKIDIGLLEAYLFSTHSPLTAGRLAELFSLESTKPIRKALRILNEQYEQTRRCFRVEQVAGGFQLLTLPEFGEGLKALVKKEEDSKLTKAALETLAIIAYKQPILRADVESIRGVASGETIRSLMEKHLVKIAGRAEEPGRPILYGTTKRFLEVFGLNSLKDLPQPEALQARAQQMAAAARLASQPDEPQEAPADTAESAPAQEPAATEPAASTEAAPTEATETPTVAEAAPAEAEEASAEPVLGPGTDDTTQVAEETAPADEQPSGELETLPADEEPAAPANEEASAPAEDVAEPVADDAPSDSAEPQPESEAPAKDE